jgi:hypothetical protein
MEYMATTTFMADGKEIRRGSIIKGKTVSKWPNYMALEEAGYIRKIETPGE